VKAANFWERNLAFMNEKNEKLNKLEQRFNRHLTFQPEILPKSREMSKSSDRSHSQFRSRPWFADRKLS